MVKPKRKEKNDHDQLNHDDDNEDLPYGLSDEENGSGGDQGTKKRVSRKQVVDYEEDFYDPEKEAKKNKKKSKNSTTTTTEGIAYCQQITADAFQFQSDTYTKEAIDQLSKQIRRHPSVAAKSYRFLHRSLSIKILHQIIRIVGSALLALLLIGIIIAYPLPQGMNRITMSPTSSSIIDDVDGAGEMRHAPPPVTRESIKDGWTRFSVIGISNYLCSNYNLNPLMDVAMMSTAHQHDHEMKNIKIFGACIVAGVALFVLWLVSMRLSDRETVLDASIPSQLGHVFMSLVLIPLASMIFWAMFVLYFIQTVAMGAEATPEDTFRCVSRLSGGLQELGTFAPFRELFVGAIAIAMRVVNGLWAPPLSTLALHDLAGCPTSTAKLISFVWSVAIGCAIYHLAIIISTLYSVFRDNSQIKKRPRDSHLVNLDLNFLPSFVPEVVSSQNFLIISILTISSLVLWFIFKTNQSLILNVHEGEIFYIVLALVPMFKSIYHLLVIEQRKNHIPQVEDFKQDEDIIKHAIY